MLQSTTPPSSNAPAAGHQQVQLRDPQGQPSRWRTTTAAPGHIRPACEQTVHRLQRELQRLNRGAYAEPAVLLCPDQDHVEVPRSRACWAHEFDVHQERPAASGQRQQDIWTERSPGSHHSGTKGVWAERPLRGYRCRQQAHLQVDRQRVNRFAILPHKSGLHQPARTLQEAPSGAKSRHLMTSAHRCQSDLTHDSSIGTRSEDPISTRRDQLGNSA